MHAIRYLLFVLLAAHGTYGQDPTPAVSSAWNVYSNARYKYEIRYPPEFDIWPTGVQEKLDGGSIRVALKEYAAPAPVLDIYVGANAAGASRLPETGTRDMDVDAHDIEVAGAPARQVTYRWKENGEIAFVQMSGKEVVFLFRANAGLHDIRDTVWWRIIQAFRFLEK